MLGLDREKTNVNGGAIAFSVIHWAQAEPD